MKKALAFVGFLFLAAAPAAHSQIETVIWEEDFQSLSGSLQPAVEEDIPDTVLGWTQTPPAGWSIDNSGMPAAGLGRDEWYGWSFATSEFWVTADDQQRSEFLPEAGGDNIVAVADPDEYDDLDSAASGAAFNSLLRTPVVEFGSNAGETLAIQFDSSQRMEPTQILRLTAVYSDGSDEQLLEWSSANGTADATNSTEYFELNVPDGATNAYFDFELVEGNNDWWWAVDNIQVGSTVVPEPSTMGMMALGLAAFAGMIRRRR